MREVVKDGLSYIRGRYGADSKEYREALIAHNRCYSGTPLHGATTTSVPASHRWRNQTSSPSALSVLAESNSSKRSMPEPKVLPPTPKPEANPELQQFDLSKMVSDIASEKPKEVPKPKEELIAEPASLDLRPMPGESPRDYILRRKKLLGNGA